MQNRRSFFGVIIKLMTFLGLLLLTLVLINSLFTNDANVPKTANDELLTVTLNIAGMQTGQIKKIRWNNKEIAILLRQFPEKLVQQKIVNSEEELHASMKTQTRSQKPEYFVYFNAGDSGNCPLYYAGGVFRDVCSSNKFDEAGRDINANSHSYMLRIPPHHFNQDKVIIGKWQAQSN